MVQAGWLLERAQAPASGRAPPPACSWLLLVWARGSLRETGASGSGDPAHLRWEQNGGPKAAGRRTHSPAEGTCGRHLLLCPKRDTAVQRQHKVAAAEAPSSGTRGRDPRPAACPRGARLQAGPAAVWREHTGPRAAACQQNTCHHDLHVRSVSDVPEPRAWFWLHRGPVALSCRGSHRTCPVATEDTL